MSPPDISRPGTPGTPATPGKVVWSGPDHPPPPLPYQMRPRITHYELDPSKVWQDLGAETGWPNAKMVWARIFKCLPRIALDRAVFEQAPSSGSSTPRGREGYAPVYKVHPAELWENISILGRMTKPDPTIPYVAHEDLKALLFDMRGYIKAAIHPELVKESKSKSGPDWAREGLVILEIRFWRLFKLMLGSVQYTATMNVKPKVQKAQIELRAHRYCLAFDNLISSEFRREKDADSRIKDATRKLGAPELSEEKKLEHQRTIKEAYEIKKSARPKADDRAKGFFKKIVDIVLACPFPLAELYGEMYYLLQSIKAGNDSEYLGKSIILARCASAKAGRGSKPFLHPDYVSPPPTGYHKPVDGGTPMKMVMEQALGADHDFSPLDIGHHAVIYSGSDQHIVALDCDAYDRISTSDDKNLARDLGTQRQWHYYKPEHGTFEDPMSSQPLPYHLQEHFKKVIIPAHNTWAKKNPLYKFDERTQKHFKDHDRRFHEKRTYDEAEHRRYETHLDVYLTVRRLPDDIYKGFPFKPNDRKPGSGAPHSGGGPSGGAAVGAKPAAEGSHQVHAAAQLPASPKAQIPASPSPYLGNSGHAGAQAYKGTNPSQLRALQNLPGVPTHIGTAGSPGHPHQPPIEKAAQQLSGLHFAELPELPELLSPNPSGPGTPQHYPQMAIAEGTHTHTTTGSTPESPLEFHLGGGHFELAGSAHTPGTVSPAAGSNPLTSRPSCAAQSPAGGQALSQHAHDLATRLSKLRSSHPQDLQQPHSPQTTATPHTHAMSPYTPGIAASPIGPRARSPAITARSSEENLQGHTAGSPGPLAGTSHPTPSQPRNLMDRFRELR